MKINELIKNKRLKLKETQEEFGNRFGVEPNTVCRWETGENEASYRVIEFVLEEQWEQCPTCKGKGIIKSV